jgi:hypothetical protein
MPWYGEETSMNIPRYDGEDQLETVYVDRNTLMVQDQTLSDGALITVKQVDDSGHVLSSSSDYTFH